MSLSLATGGVICTEGGEPVYVPVAVCDPEVSTQKVGVKAMDGKEIVPSMKVKDVSSTDLVPIIEGEVIGDKDVGFTSMIPTIKVTID